MGNFIDRIPFILLIIFVSISLLIFYPAANAGFVYDYIGWAEHYKDGNYLEALNSFGYKGLHPILHVTALTLTKLFGVKSEYWYIFTSTLHGLNAFVLFRFLSLFLKTLNFNNHKLAALSVAVLFLIHPYNIEPVVYRACIHYLISFLCIIYSLYFINKYFVTNNPKQYFLAILLYTAALFSLEISYITGLLWFIIALSLNYLSQDKRYKLPRLILKFLVVPLSLLGGYLILTYLKIGNAVGHYGAERHLRFDLFEVLNNSLDYLMKHLFFARDYNLYSTSIYDKISSHIGLVLIALSVLAFILFALIKTRSISLKLSSISLLLFGVALLPILNLYFYSILLSENDRYGYLASPFIITSFVLFTWHFKSKVRFVPLVLYFLLSVYLFSNLVNAWNESGKAFTGLLESFKGFDKKEVILLNTPDNYKGIFMFRTLDDRFSAFNEALDVLFDSKYEGNIISVAEFSMLRPLEKVAIQSDSSNHIKVTFSEWGSWWIKNSLGASPYENDRVAFKPDGMAYNLLIKGDIDPEETIILYSEGDKWKPIDIMAVKSPTPTKLNNNDGVY